MDVNGRVAVGVPVIQEDGEDAGDGEQELEQKSDITKVIKCYEEWVIE